MKSKLNIVLAGLAFLLGGGMLYGADATQSFKVIVPQSVTITAPAAVEITHDQTDNLQAFPTQIWTVRGNGLAGVNVTFETQQPFTHATDNSFKRNAKIDLAVGTKQGPADWTISKATDTSDYATNKNKASVAASSNGVGRAQFNINVSFVTDSFGTFAAGDYLTTVVGTVTAK